MRIFTRNQTSNETGNQLNGSSAQRGLALAAGFAALALFVILTPGAQAQASMQPIPDQTANQTQFGNAQTLCQPQVIGNRRIPKESVLARLFSHQGDLYDRTIVERDYNSLWNTGYFAEVRIEEVATPACLQLIVYVKEKPTIREINYKGLNAVPLSDVADRLKKEKAGFTVESQYDPTRVQHAENVIKALLGEHGHQFATIKVEVKNIPPAAVAITFDIKEGPTVKVGKIVFDGNDNLSDRYLRNSMKNLKPIGVPNSIVLEDLFSRTYDASKLDEDTERIRQAYRDKGYFKANPGEPVTKIRDITEFNPFLLHTTTGKRIDLLIPIEEGERYRLGGITFKGNKAFSNTRALRAQFQIKDGEYFNATVFSKGLQNLQKAYSAQGYINFTGAPTPRK